MANTPLSAGVAKPPLAQAPPPAITRILISKEWVLPPRPKPGRKPAEDTPASKRKAQNRQAQRAFRERRATRVQELETQLLEQERARDAKEMALLNLIQQLRAENQQLALALGRRGSPAPLPELPAAAPYQQISPAPSPGTSSSPPAQDCGACQKDACICQAIGVAPSPAGSSPVTPADLHAVLSLTTMARSEAPLQESAGPKQPHMDCGFCTDDTPCVCRDGAEAGAETMAVAVPLPVPVPLPVRLPRPVVRTEFEVGSGAVPLPRPAPGSSTLAERQQKLSLLLLKKPGCTGNPGTCFTCQRDPMSTLFCTTIASKSSSTPAAARNLPALEPGDPTLALEFMAVVARADAQPPSRHGLAVDLVASATVQDSGVFIPIPDAYRTLLRHERFRTMDFNDMVRRLHTRDMQVEVGSVAKLLREMDRQLYN